MNLEEAEEQLWDKTKIDSVTGCWNYKSHAKNYPTIYVDGREETIHRISWKLFRGEFPEIVHHTCENIICWNPEHLLATDISSHVSQHHKQDEEQFPCGHPRIPSNMLPGTVYKKTGSFSYYCKICDNERSRRYRDKKNS
jgi:hypothetical protein